MLLTLALLSALHAAPTADSLAGTWRISGDMSGNALDQTCTLAQADTTLSGTCEGPQGEKIALTGRVKAGKVTFQYASTYEGQPLTVVYSGTLASPKQIKGTIEIQPKGWAGTFTATPAPAKP